MSHTDVAARRAYAAKYREANRERIRAYQVAYLERHPERRASSIKESNAKEKTRENKAAYRDRSRDLLRAAGRAYSKLNRAKANAALARYRAAKLQATPLWADQSLIEAFYEEAKRRSDADGVPYHVDHIIPLQGKLVCGLHVQTNLQVMPGVENQRKGNRVCL